MPQSAIKKLEVHADMDGSAWPTTTVSNGVVHTNETTHHVPDSQRKLVADIQPNGDLEMHNMNVYVVDSGKSPTHKKYTPMHAASEQEVGRMNAKADLEQGPESQAPRDKYLYYKYIIIFDYVIIRNILSWAITDISNTVCPPRKIQSEFGYRLRKIRYRNMKCHTGLWNNMTISHSQWRPRPIWSSSHKETRIFVMHGMDPFPPSFVTWMFKPF